MQCCVASELPPRNCRRQAVLGGKLHATLSLFDVQSSLDSSGSEKWHVQLLRGIKVCRMSGK